MTSTSTTSRRAWADGEEGSRLHLGVAEQGKVHALSGEHDRALFYYRKAMEMAVENGDSEIFFRHYLECVLESLERQGLYDEIFDYCDKAERLYGDTPPRDPVVLRDLAHVYQRRGVVRLKAGDREGAREALGRAIELLTGSGQTLPLASTLARWLDIGLHLDRARIEAEQERHEYFSVRPGAVDPERAIRLPAAMMPPALQW